MNYGELQLSFDIQLDKADIVGYPSFLPEEKDFWLNKAVRWFVKTRYSGVNTHQTGFQQSEKRDNDLRGTILEYNEPFLNQETAVDVVRPDDFWFAVGEDITISSLDLRWPTIPFSSISNTSTTTMTIDAGNPTGSILPLTEFYINVVNTEAAGEIVYDTLIDEKTCIISVNSSSSFPVIIDGVSYNPGTVILFNFNTVVSPTATITELEGIPSEKTVDALECTIENFTSRKENPLSEHRLHRNYAKPLRLSANNVIHLETDTNYYFTNYKLLYISTPILINYQSPYTEFTYISEQAHDEIVSIAVRLALENVSDPRYQTTSVENQIME